MAERGITKADICKVLENGRVIMRYPNDTPIASRIVLGYSGKRPLHVVAADDDSTATTIIITVYEPGPDRWHDGFEERKRL